MKISWNFPFYNIFFPILISILTVFNSYGQDKSWQLDIGGGAPWNLPAGMKVFQDGSSTIHLKARFESEPFTLPVYWVWRISRNIDNISWEFEAVHHKLYLKNAPPEIQFFSISHGYNLLMINRRQLIRGYKCMDILLRFGGGTVLSHPENEIRNLKLDENHGINGTGYYVSGPVLNVSIGIAGKIAHPVIWHTEVKFNPSCSKVPVFAGHAILWNFPVTLSFGIGMKVF